MPNRNINESFWLDDRIAALSDFEFRLWIGLITVADNAGRGDARPAILKGRIFPLRGRLTLKDIDVSLRALAAKGCVSLYDVDGRPYFWFPEWVKHQRIREDRKSKFPAPPDASGGELPQMAADGREWRRMAASGGEWPPMAASGRQWPPVAAKKLPEIWETPKQADEMNENTSFFRSETDAYASSGQVEDGHGMMQQTLEGCFEPEKSAENRERKRKKESNTKKERKRKRGEIENARAGARARENEIPPPPEAVAAYFAEKGSTQTEAEAFCDFYASKGWKVGKEKMVNWRAAASGWIRRGKERDAEKQKTAPAKTWQAQARQTFLEMAQEYGQGFHQAGGAFNNDGY